MGGGHTIRDRVRVDVGGAVRAEYRPAGRYRVMAVVAKHVSDGMVRQSLGLMGAEVIKMWRSEADLPPGWPANRRRIDAGPVEAPIWAEVEWPGGDVPPGGVGWRIVDMWPVDEGASAGGAEGAPVKAGPRGSHRWARPILIGACLQVLETVPPLHVVQWLQGVAHFESRYGWPGGKWDGHHNWGAITRCAADTSTREPSCPCKGFPAVDRTERGEHVSCFASYDTDQEGAEGLLAWFARRPDVLAEITQAREPWQAALAMRRAAYFGMKLGPDGTLMSASDAAMEHEARTYGAAVERSMRAMARELGEAYAWADRRAEVQRVMWGLGLTLLGSITWPIGQYLWRRRHDR